MIDFFTYFIYLSLMATLILLSSYKQRLVANKLDFEVIPKLKPQNFVALFILSFVVGFRYYVGTDWDGYVAIFEQLLDTGYSVYPVEWGYLLINLFVIKIGGNYTIMFAIITFISWYFLFKSVNYKLLPLFIFFIFADEYFFWSMSGIRQFVAISIFVFAIRFIINSNFKVYFLLILFASLFHLSALFLIPLYFVPYQKLYNNKLWGIIFVLSFYFANTSYFVNGIEILYLKIAGYIPYLSVYTRFFENGSFQEKETILGLGAFFRFLIALFILYFSNEVVLKYPNTKIYFILFFIGSIIFNLFFMFNLMGRFNNYFLIMRSFVLATVIYYLWKEKKYRVIPVLIILAYFFLFLVVIYNSSNMCSPFRFSF